MATVKILHGHVGMWKEGDIVIDAPPGLVNMALQETKNAATGQLVAELLFEDSKEIFAPEWATREKELMDKLAAAESREADLLAKLAEKDMPDEESDEDLKALKSTAKTMKIAGYTKMSADELRAAIAVAGGAGDGE